MTYSSFLNLVFQPLLAIIIDHLNLPIFFFIVGSYGIFG